MYTVKKGILSIVLLVGVISLFAQQELVVLNRGSHEIIAYDLENPGDYRIVLSADSRKLVNPYDLCYIKITEQFLWPDASLGSVFNSTVQGKLVASIRTDSLSKPVDIAIDEENERLYWLDYQEKKIFRADFDGNNEEEVLGTEMVDPTCIVVSPQYDRLFWADKKTKKIYSSTLEGGDVQVLIDTESGYAVRMVADEASQVLYWTDDVHNRVYSANFSGGEVQEIYRGKSEEHPFGLYYDPLDHYLYWTDYGIDQVKRIQPFTTEIAEVVVENAQDPIALVILEQGASLRQAEKEALEGQPQLAVAPNPATNHLNVSLNHTLDGATLIIYNQVGQAIKEMPMSGQRLRLNVSELTGGWYICEVKNQDQRLYKQFVILK